MEAAGTSVCVSGGSLFVNPSRGLYLTQDVLRLLPLAGFFTPHVDWSFIYLQTLACNLVKGNREIDDG